MTPKITFLGIGLMGAPMAARLLDQGFSVCAWNRTFDKAAALTGLGARAEPDLHHALHDADIVISMIESGAVVEQLIEDALAALKPEALWIDMSSTRQDEAVAFHAKLEALGFRFLDAPVSGGVAGAEAGTLAIMAGGSVQDFGYAEPVLQAMGRPMLVGPAGSG